MSDQSELYYAEMEAARNEAEKTYFDARPTLDTKIHHLIFRVGFVRGFNLLWDKQQSAADQMERLRQRVTELEAKLISWQEASHE